LEKNIFYLFGKGRIKTVVTSSSLRGVFMENSVIGRKDSFIMFRKLRNTIEMRTLFHLVPEFPNQTENKSDLFVVSYSEKMEQGHS
jgi:hypothetical protein